MSTTPHNDTDQWLGMLILTQKVGNCSENCHSGFHRTTMPAAEHRGRLMTQPTMEHR